MGLFGGQMLPILSASCEGFAFRKDGCLSRGIAASHSAPRNVRCLHLLRSALRGSSWFLAFTRLFWVMLTVFFDPWCIIRYLHYFWKNEPSPGKTGWGAAETSNHEEEKR